MGTRGLFCFYYKGKLYRIYNHYDSHPEALGRDLLREIKNAIEEGNLELWKEQLANIKIVHDYDVIDEETIKLLCPYKDPYISLMEKSWYSCLRHCQGSYKRVLQSGYLLDTDTNDWVCKYVLDFDNEKFTYSGGGKEISFSLDHLPEEISFEVDI